MKLTRNINLHGVVLTIDEDAYQALKEYLSDIEGRLPADEQKDVMEDLESRIAELLQSALFAQSAQVVTMSMIEDIERRIGDPSEFGENKRPMIKRERINRQGVGRVMTILLKAVLILIAIQLLFPVLATIFGILMGFFGLSIGGIALIPALGFELATLSTGWTWTLALSLFVAGAVPVFIVVYWIVRWLREHKHPSLAFWLITLLIWMISIAGMIVAGIHIFAANSADLFNMISAW